MVALAEDLKIPNQITFDSQWKWSITTVLVSGAVNDLLIAGGLTYYMRGGRHQESVFPNWTIVKFSVREYMWCDVSSVTALMFLQRPAFSRVYWRQSC